MEPVRPPSVIELTSNNSSSDDEDLMAFFYRNQTAKVKEITGSSLSTPCRPSKKRKYNACLSSITQLNTVVKICEEEEALSPQTTAIIVGQLRETISKLAKKAKDVDESDSETEDPDD
jgi:hypothetical protein